MGWEDHLPCHHSKRQPRSALIHPAYSLIWLDLYDGEAPLFIRRLLRHPEFNSHTKRMGKVIRLHPQSMNFWAQGKGHLQTVKWPAVI